MDSDFPNLWETFTPLDASDNRDIRAKIEAYRQYSMEADRLMETGGTEWERHVDRYESLFIVLIESDDWFLVDSSGRRRSILIPNFTQDGGIVWRWRPNA